MKRNNELKEIVYIICLVTFVDNHPENETSIFFLYIYISYSLSLSLSLSNFNTSILNFLLFFDHPIVYFNNINII